MEVSYDPQADAAYIRILEGKFEVTTLRLSEDVAVNLTPDGRVVGIEVLSARRNLFQSESEPKIRLKNLQPIC